jgi:hypothetical protein
MYNESSPSHFAGVLTEHTAGILAVVDRDPLSDGTPIRRVEKPILRPTSIRFIRNPYSVLEAYWNRRAIIGVPINSMEHGRKFKAHTLGNTHTLVSLCSAKQLEEGRLFACPISSH